MTKNNDKESKNNEKALLSIEDSNKESNIDTNANTDSNAIELDFNIGDLDTLDLDF